MIPRLLFLSTGRVTMILMGSKRSNIATFGVGNLYPTNHGWKTWLRISRLWIMDSDQDSINVGLNTLEFLLYTLGSDIQIIK